MDAAKLSAKHQVVLPKAMREVLGVKAGDELMFVSRNGIVYILPRAGSLVRELKGLAKGRLHYPRNYLKKERNSW